VVRMTISSIPCFCVSSMAVDVLARVRILKRRFYSEGGVRQTTPSGGRPATFVECLASGPPPRMSFSRPLLPRTGGTGRYFISHAEPVSVAGVFPVGEVPRSASHDGPIHTAGRPDNHRPRRRPGPAKLAGGLDPPPKPAQREPMPRAMVQSSRHGSIDRPVVPRR
jgi:hypothetical protein